MIQTITVELTTAQVYEIERALVRHANYRSRLKRRVQSPDKAIIHQACIDRINVVLRSLNSGLRELTQKG